jgi:hypothetical protein
MIRANTGFTKKYYHKKSPFPFGRIKIKGRASSVTWKHFRRTCSGSSIIINRVAKRTSTSLSWKKLAAAYQWVSGEGTLKNQRPALDLICQRRTHTHTESVRNQSAANKWINKSPGQWASVIVKAQKSRRLWIINPSAISRPPICFVVQVRYARECVPLVAICEFVCVRCIWI